jgi:hypothetical protein
MKLPPVVGMPVHAIGHHLDGAITSIHGDGFKLTLVSGGMLYFSDWRCASVITQEERAACTHPNPARSYGANYCPHCGHRWGGPAKGTYARIH